MARCIRFAGGILLVTSTTLSTSSTSTQPSLTIGGYVKVSEVRVTRTVTEFVYRATLANAGPALAGATAQASSGSSATTIVDASLTFDRSFPVEPSSAAIRSPFGTIGRFRSTFRISAG